MGEKEILKAHEVAQILRVETQRVWELCRNRSIPFILLGNRQYRFSRSAIMKWIANGGNQHQKVRDDKTSLLEVQ